MKEDKLNKFLMRIWEKGGKMYRWKIPLTDLWIIYFKPWHFFVAKFRASGFTRGEVDKS